MSRAIECGGIIVDKYLKNLLIVYQRASKKWGLPKGHMDFNEIRNNDREKCAKREILEETGLDLNKLPNTIIGKENMNNKVFFIYKLDCSIEQLSLMPRDKNEILDVIWINLDNINMFTDKNECNRSLREFNKRKFKLRKKMTKNTNFIRKTCFETNKFQILNAVEV